MATESFSGELSQLEFEELEAELATLAAHLSAGMCRWLELVGELDRRGGWTDCGAGSCAEFLAWRCALSPRAAREHVRVARALPELPLTHAAFAKGELSYAKVRALTRIATAENEAGLLEFARAFTAAQLERSVATYRRVTTDEARDLQDGAFLSVYWDEDGSLEIRGRLAPEDGAVLVKAIEALRDRIWEEGRGSAEPRPAQQASKAEALVAVAEAALAKPEASRPAGERYQVVIHAEESVLSEDAEGECALDEGAALAPETARRIACDASLVRDGRKTRAVAPALRRALTRRDRGCRFPGCENRRFLDAHHVRHWAQGGPTTLDNLVLLCRLHHRAVHEGGDRVDTDGNFYDVWGRQIERVPALPRGDPDALVERNGELAIGACTCQSGDGDPAEIGDLGDALVSAGLTGPARESRAPAAPSWRIN